MGIGTGRGWRAGAAVVTAAVLCGALGAPAAPAEAAGGRSAATEALPGGPEGAPWRQGAVPMRSFLRTTASQAAAAGAGPDGSPTEQSPRVQRPADPLLFFDGGIGGVGVMTGHPEVYLDFWGSQWGTETLGSGGGSYDTFSGDPDGIAPVLQAFFAGLGTDSERWSGVMTEYCQGVAVGTTTCPPTNAEHVGYPTGGALAGVWEDDASAAPQAATAHQLALEAVAAADHFGNTTTASNRDAQYFIVSPHGTNPDQFDLLPASEDFCAWHDYAFDGDLDGGGPVPASDPDVSFTNMPYVTDAGEGCGEDFVRSGAAGRDDGVTLIAGHEYAETITDPRPPGGWIDQDVNEAADKCIWIPPGERGGAGLLTLATGRYPVQAIWANDAGGGAGGCERSHPVETDVHPDQISVGYPGPQSDSVGQAVRLQLSARDSASSARLTYSASGLPAGVRIDPSTGTVSGTARSASVEPVTVTASDPSGASGSTTFLWAVGSAACPGSQLVRNGGFETGRLAPWRGPSGLVVSNAVADGQERSHTGRYFAWMSTASGPENLSQQLTVGARCRAGMLSLYYHVDTSEPPTSRVDRLRVELLGRGGARLATVATWSNLDAAGGYRVATIAVSHWLHDLGGIELQTSGTGTSPTGMTDFVLDDISLAVG